MHLKILIGVLTLTVVLAKPQISADIFGKDASDVLPKDPTSGIFNTYIIHPSHGQSGSPSAQEIRPSLTTILQLFRPMISLSNPSLLSLNTGLGSGYSNNVPVPQTDNRLNQVNVPQSVGTAPVASPPQVINPTVVETAPSNPSVADTPVQTNPSVTVTPVQTNPSVTVTPVQTTVQPQQASSSSIPLSVSTEPTTTTTAASNGDDDYYSYNYNDDDD